MLRIVAAILLMALGTYLPRLLPMIFLKGMKLPRRLQAFLAFIPYAALGALIMPGILNSTGNIRSAAIGGVVSAVLSYFRLNVVIVVFGGIIGALLAEIIF